MKQKFTDNGNSAEVTYVSRDRPTLEDALQDVDMNVWEVDHYITNQWDGFRKSGSKDITFTDGVMNGETHDKGGVVIVPLYQIKVWLRRKVAFKTVIPPIAPVKVVVRKGRAKKHKNNRKVALVIPDIHVGFRRKGDELVPFHDKTAVASAMEVARDVQPDRIVFLGDLLDMPDWSDKFVREPDFQYLTQEALKEAAYILGKFRALCPEAKIDYLEGNHSQRLYRLVLLQIPTAYGLKPVDCELPAMSIPNLLGLERLDVTYHGDYPNNKVWLNDNLACIHGNTVKARSGQTASAILENSNHSIVFGHIHRHEQATECRWHRDGSRIYTAYTPGCLCRTDGVVPGVRAEQNWVQGFGVVFYREGNRNFNIVHVPVISGRALFNGKEYSGSFR